MPSEPSDSAASAPDVAPAVPPPSLDPAAPPGLAGEAEAWAAVVAAWDDEAAHAAYLARFRDLEGLAVAGGRYRAVLDARPGDATARRYRDEVVRRATAAGLALLPRAAPPAERRARRVRAAAVGVVLALLAALVAVFGRGLAAGVRELWAR